MLNGINHINNLWFQFGLSQHWSNCEEIPYIQGQRSPSKMVGGAKAHLKSNPTPTRDCTLPDSGRVQTEPYAHQDWGERSSDPHKRLTQTFPWVSRSLWGRRQWVVPSAGLGALSVAVYAWDLLKEVSHYLHHLHHSLASGQTTGREHSPPTENWIKDLLSMALPIRTRPSFPPQAVSPIRKLV